MSQKYLQVSMGVELKVKRVQSRERGPHGRPRICLKLFLSEQGFYNKNITNENFLLLYLGSNVKRGVLLFSIVKHSIIKWNSLAKHKIDMR